MKPSKSLILASLLLALPCAAQQIPVASSIGYEGTNSSNNIVLTWESIPTKLYNVLTTTVLGQQPWVPLNPSPIYSSNNLVRYRDTNSQPARFYKVVKLDTDPPEIWRLNPGSNSIAVARQSSLKAYLRDETAIDPVSITLTIGTNPPVNLSDPRLSFTNDVLTYTPGTNEFLGTNTQIVSASLAVSDPLNHRSTNSWSFQIEQVPVIAANVLLIGGSPAIAAASAGAAASPGLMLVSTNGDTFVFSYTGGSSRLASGQILVSADTNFLYKRKVISFTEDSASHTVSVTTEIASLAECLQQGSVRLTGDFVEQVATGLQAAGAGQGTIGASIPLDGTVLINSGSIRVEVVSGQISFTPGFTVSGEFTGGRLVSFDSEVSGTLGLDMTLRGSLQATGDWSDALPLTTPIRRFKLLGFVGGVPVWAEAVLEFNIGYEVHAEAVGAVTAGFESSRTLTFGARLRAGQWNLNHPADSSTLLVRDPTWEITGAGNVTVYVEPKLTVYLESLAGLSVNLKRYLEAEGNASVQPGRAGVNLSLYSGLSSTLAVDVRGWDDDWGTLPFWELFNLRERIYYKDLSTSIGLPPQTVPNMVWIPGGTFVMGSPPNESLRFPYEGPQTRVTINQGFWMGLYEVTQGEYLAVVGNNPSYFPGDPNRPVEQVSWEAAVGYCTALTTRERNAGRLPAGYVYRLPTEAEWEYAGRAGTSTAFHYGPGLRSGMGNFDGRYEYESSIGTINKANGTYLGRTATVGSYAPNAWGLYDMHGNVWEWCSDWWSSSLPGGSVIDPQGPATGSLRVRRGGSFDYNGYRCRSADRYYYSPHNYCSCIGFRVVLAQKQNVITPIPNMVSIPSGTFTMGSPASEPARRDAEGPQTLVTISRSFWIGRTEVTQGEYQAVTGSNPSYFTAVNGYSTDLSRPVEQVSWNDAVAYCGAITTRERNAGRLPSGYVYRLPTYAEWEYACRATTTTAFHYGDALRSGMASFDGHKEYPPCAEQAHYCYNPTGTYLERTTTVGTYAPNTWGLFDMHGNVREWCNDWSSSSLPGGSVVDPQGSAIGGQRVLRGGCWDCSAMECRSAYRVDLPPDGRSSAVGFRVVLAQVSPKQ